MLIANVLCAASVSVAVTAEGGVFLDPTRVEEQVLYSYALLARTTFIVSYSIHVVCTRRILQCYNNWSLKLNNLVAYNLVARKSVDMCASVFQVVLHCL